MLKRPRIISHVVGEGAVGRVPGLRGIQVTSPESTVIPSEPRRSRSRAGIPSAGVRDGPSGRRVVETVVPFEVRVVGGMIIQKIGGSTVGGVYGRAVGVTDIMVRDSGLKSPVEIGHVGNGVRKALIICVVERRTAGIVMRVGRPRGIDVAECLLDTKIRIVVGEGLNVTLVMILFLVGMLRVWGILDAVGARFRGVRPKVLRT